MQTMTTPRIKPIIPDVTGLKSQPIGRPLPAQKSYFILFLKHANSLKRDTKISYSLK